MSVYIKPEPYHVYSPHHLRSDLFQPSIQALLEYIASETPMLKAIKAKKFITDEHKLMHILERLLKAHIITRENGQYTFNGFILTNAHLQNFPSIEMPDFSAYPDEMASYFLGKILPEKLHLEQPQVLIDQTNVFNTWQTIDYLDGGKYAWQIISTQAHTGQNLYDYFVQASHLNWKNKSYKTLRQVIGDTNVSYFTTRLMQKMKRQSAEGIYQYTIDLLQLESPILYAKKDQERFEAQLQQLQQLGQTFIKDIENEMQYLSNDEAYVFYQWLLQQLNFKPKEMIFYIG